MPKIIINYKISDDMEVSFSPEIEELGKYGSLEKFKELSKKYVVEMDNQMNLDRKVLKEGSLKFVIEKIKK